MTVAVDSSWDQRAIRENDRDQTVSRQDHRDNLNGHDKDETEQELDRMVSDNPMAFDAKDHRHLKWQVATPRGDHSGILDHATGSSKKDRHHQTESDRKHQTKED